MATEDVARLVELWVASWRETIRALDFDARRTWITAVLRHPTHTTLVAEEAGRLAGFANFEGAYLHQLVVAPEAKGRGVATRLLAAAKARSPTGLALDVNQANPRAVRFYVREGFVIVGEGTNPASGLATYAMAWHP